MVVLKQIKQGGLKASQYPGFPHLEDVILVALHLNCFMRLVGCVQKNPNQCKAKLRVGPFEGLMCLLMDLFIASISSVLN